jgi:tRNA (Thr-GGU) A37 N-methylase
LSFGEPLPYFAPTRFAGGCRVTGAENGQLDRSYPAGSAEAAVITVNVIGQIRSRLQQRAEAPKQGNEGAPPAWLEFKPEFAIALRNVAVGEEILLLTWLDRADRSILQVHPRDDESAPLRGVFSTRSPDRPNPIGSRRSE